MKGFAKAKTALERQEISVDDLQAVVLEEIQNNPGNRQALISALIESFQDGVLTGENLSEIMAALGTENTDLQDYSPTQLITPDKTTSAHDPGLQSSGVGVGSTLRNRYLLEDCLLDNETETLYRARDLRKEETRHPYPFVAIRVLEPGSSDDRATLIALQKEVSRAQELHHPNIATVFDFDRDGDRAYMVMEHQPGQSLANYIHKQGPHGLESEAVKSLVTGMINALAYAHEKHVVHGDFDPSKVWITQGGEIKVMNFGVDRLIGGETTPERFLEDTTIPRYASPETIEGRAPDIRDDIYSLACVIYEVMTGRPPFDEEGTLAAKLNLPRPEQISRKRWRVLRQALELDREKRLTSVVQLMKVVEQPTLRATTLAIPLVFLFGALAVAISLPVVAPVSMSGILALITQSVIVLVPPVAVILLIRRALSAHVSRFFSIALFTSAVLLGGETLIFWANLLGIVP